MATRPRKKQQIDKGADLRTSTIYRMLEILDHILMLPGDEFSARQIARTIKMASSTLTDTIDKFQTALNHKVIRKRYKRDHYIVDRSRLVEIHLRLVAIKNQLLDLKADARRPHARIRIATVPTAIHFFFARVLARLPKELPGVEIEFITGAADSSEVLSYIRHGVVDMAVMPYQDELEVLGHRLTYEPLFGPTIKGLIFNNETPGIPERLRRAVKEPREFHFKDLKGQTFYLISRSVRSDIYRFMMERLIARNVGVKHIISVQGYSHVTDLVRANGGCGIGHLDQGAEEDPRISFVDITYSPDLKPPERQPLRKMLFGSPPLTIVTRNVSPGDHRTSAETLALQHLSSVIKDVGAEFRRHRDATNPEWVPRSCERPSAVERSEDSTADQPRA